MHMLSLRNNVSIFMILGKNFLLIIIVTSWVVFVTKLKFKKIS